MRREQKCLRLSGEKPYMWMHQVNWWLDPVVKGYYPIEGKVEYDNIASS